jgi:hypothetical protein
MAVEIRRADYATPFYPQKLALISPTSGGRSVYGSLADSGYGVGVTGRGGLRRRRSYVFFRQWLTDDDGVSLKRRPQFTGHEDSWY